jgi:hypothetical protein
MKMAGFAAAAQCSGHASPVTLFGRDFEIK